MRKWWVGLALGLSFSGCSGSSDGGSSAPTPPEECETFIDDYCGRVAACVIQNNEDPGATEAQEETSCADAAKANLPCEKAVAVGTTYNSCITEVKAIACSAVTAAEQSGNVAALVPTDCDQVIKLLE